MPNEYHNKFIQAISDLGITDLEFNKIDEKSAIFIAFGKINNQKVVVKSFLDNNLEKIANLKKERQLSELASKPELENLFKPIAITPVAANGKYQDMIWYQKSFIEGQILGDDHKDPSQLLWNCDVINQSYLDRSDWICPQIVDALQRFKEMDPEVLLKFMPDSLDQVRFKDRSSMEALELFESKLRIDLSAVRKFLMECQQNLEATDKFFCFNDLVPPNILICDKQVRFMDVERACLDYNLSDLAELWLFLWRYPIWQEKLLSSGSLINNKQDRELFRFLIIRRIFMKGMETRFERDLLQNNHKHKWLNYLMAAGESFEALIDA